MTDMTRRNIFLPDALWTKMQKEAADAGAKRGQPMHVSEWVRNVLERAVKVEL